MVRVVKGNFTCLSPEAELNGNGFCRALGVLLWELFTYGEVPYGEQTPEQVISGIIRGQRLDLSDKWPEDVQL